LFSRSSSRRRGIFMMQVQTDPFNFSSSRSAEKFSSKVCSEKFTQGPVDPDPVFNRDRFCVQKILGKIRLKKFRTNPVIFVILNADPAFCTHATPPQPKCPHPLTITTQKLHISTQKPEGVRGGRAGTRIFSQPKPQGWHRIFIT